MDRFYKILWCSLDASEKAYYRYLFWISNNFAVVKKYALYIMNMCSMNLI